jgi:hypothetical protein
VTASASSAAASGGSASLASSSRASSRTQRRSTSRPNSGGIRPSASGQRPESSPGTTARTPIPSPRSTAEPAESPTSGAIAAYDLALPKSECSIPAYAASNASSFQSNPPDRSATAVSVGSRIVLKSASSSVEPRPEWACAKIAAAGSRRRSSIAFRVSGSRRSVGACSATNVRTSGRYSYSDGPSRVGCSSNANGSSAPRSAAKAARQNARRDS